MAPKNPSDEYFWPQWCPANMDRYQLQTQMRDKIAVEASMVSGRYDRNQLSHGRLE
jgi:hypothetical protein